MIRLLVLSYFSLFLLGLSDNMRGPLFPEILKEFSLSDMMGSFYFSVSSLFGILGGLTCPWWIRRWGAIAVLRLSFLLCGFSLLGFSSAPNFFWLIASVVFFGFSLGLMGVIQNTLVVTQTPLHLRSRMISGLHSMYALASLAAPLIVSALAQGFPDQNIWRLSFQWGAAFAGVVWLGSLGSFPLREVKPQQEYSDPRQSSFQQYYFAVIFSSYALAEILVSSRLALYMRREYQSDFTTGSYYTAAFFAALFSGRILFTFWAPRISLKQQLLTSLGLSMISLAMGLWIHPLGLVASGLFMAPFYPLMMAEIGHMFHQSLSQAVAKAVAVSSLFVVAMHFLVGSLTDQFGIKVAFALSPLFCLVAFGMLLSHEKIFHRMQS